MKIAFVTAVWKRPDVFELFAKGIDNIVKTIPDTEFKTFVAGSEGKTSEKMVKNKGFEYIEIPNQPLAAKHNSSVLEAKKWGPDYVICLGSDDILSPQTINKYLEILKEDPKVDFIGLSDFYFYDQPTNRASYWAGYLDHRKGDVCGAGILLSSRLLKMWGWKPWTNPDSNVLDNSIHSKISRTVPCRKKIFSLKDYNLFSVDIKTSINMTPFALWENSKFIDTSLLERDFSYILK